MRAVQQGAGIRTTAHTQSPWQPIIDFAQHAPPGTLPAIGTVLVFVLGVVGYLFRHSLRVFANWVGLGWRTLAQRILIVQIRTARSADVESFFSLYESSFSETERFSGVEINEWLAGKGKGNGLDYRLLLARRDGVLLGVAIYIRPNSERVIYLPYMALAQDAAASRLSQKIISKMLNAVQPKFGERYSVVFEVDDPREAGISDTEANRRYARIRRFGTLCGTTGICIRYPDITYWQPPYHTDKGDRAGRNCFLGLLPVREAGSISRDELLRCLRTVYRIYEICISSSEPRKSEMILQIERQLARYSGIPTQIALYSNPVMH